MRFAAGGTALSTGTIDDQIAARLLDQRIIVLGAEVDDQVANRLCGQLLLLSAEDPRSDVSLYINSPGGSVSFGGTAADVEIYAEQLERIGTTLLQLIS